jgi:phage-related protein
MRVLFYKSASGRCPVADYISNLPEGDKARFAEVFEEIEQHGLDAVGLIFKPLEGKLWEIKFRSVGGGFRILYVLPVRDTMVWLHAFHKKTQKTPRRDLELATARMKEVLS